MSESFDGEGVQAPGYKILQRIIHKAMARYAGEAFEARRGNPHPEMGAKARAVGPCMAGVSRALIDHFERGWRQKFRQTPVQRLRGDAGTHDFEASSWGRYRLIHKVCATMKRIISPVMPNTL